MSIIHLHGLRISAGSFRYFTNGKDIKDVQEYLNHKDMSTTAGYIQNMEKFVAGSKKNIGMIEKLKTNVEKISTGTESNDSTVEALNKIIESLKEEMTALREEKNKLLKVILEKLD